MLIGPTVCEACIDHVSYELYAFVFFYFFYFFYYFFYFLFYLIDCVMIAYLFKLLAVDLL